MCFWEIVSAPDAGEIDLMPPIETTPLLSGFVLSFFWLKHILQGETRQSEHAELVWTPQEVEHTALRCCTPGLNLSICLAVSLFAFTMAMCELLMNGIMTASLMR